MPMALTRRQPLTFALNRKGDTSTVTNATVDFQAIARGRVRHTDAELLHRWTPGALAATRPGQSGTGRSWALGDVTTLPLWVTPSAPVLHPRDAPDIPALARSCPLDFRRAPSFSCTRAGGRSTFGTDPHNVPDIPALARTGSSRICLLPSSHRSHRSAARTPAGHTFLPNP